MKFLSGVIAICSSLWLHVYLFGLQETSSAKFNGSFYVYAIMMFGLGVFALYLSSTEKKKNK